MIIDTVPQKTFSENRPSHMPGLGTYRLQGDVCFRAVCEAGKIGYRLIDTATFYDNFEPIGEALQTFSREDFYLISKVWPDAHRADRLSADLHMTLKKLQTDYLDAYLLHWPNSDMPIEETLGAMERFRSEGKIRNIGLSNVTVNHIIRAEETKIPLSCVQTEMHPSFYDPKLLEYCRKANMTVQAWSPLNRGLVDQDAFLVELGIKYKKTASQIALRWIIQHGCIPLPGSKNPGHLKENFDVNDFYLSPEETATIDAQAEKGARKRIGKASGLGFSDEFDFTYAECWPNSKKSKTIGFA